MKHLGEAAVRVLTTGAAKDKAGNSIRFAGLWREDKLKAEFLTPPPDRPARPVKPKLLPPTKMPKRGKAGSARNRAALLHAVAHIELNAIDLAWDMVARFGHDMPREFLDDWVGVGADEARHFTLLSDLLENFGVRYGDLPAHDGLWQAAFETRGDLPARLAVVPLVLEARGLDVTPGMIARFKALGEDQAASVLEIIYEEEIGHVAAGVRWFEFVCKRENLDPEKTYQARVREYFRGTLKPPFNEKARTLAGLKKEFYLPLTEKN